MDIQRHTATQNHDIGRLQLERRLSPVKQKMTVLYDLLIELKIIEYFVAEGNYENSIQ